MTVIVAGGYVNHIGSTVDGGGNVFVAITQDGPGTTDTDVLIRKRTPAGLWTDVFRFTQAVYGKHGYGTLEVVGSDLVCVLSEEEAGQIDAVERVLPGVAVPFTAGAAGSDTLVRQCLRALRQAVATALAPLG